MVWRLIEMNCDEYKGSAFKNTVRLIIPIRDGTKIAFDFQEQKIIAEIFGRNLFIGWLSDDCLIAGMKAIVSKGKLIRIDNPNKQRNDK